MNDMHPYPGKTVRNLFLADRQLTNLTKEQMGNLPFYRGSLSLGGPIIQMMDHVQYMMLCQLWMPGHGECEASIEISAEAAEKLGSSHGYALNIKTMPRWSHDGCQFVEDAEGRYEDMVFTHEKFDHWTATLRYDRTR